MNNDKKALGQRIKKIRVNLSMTMEKFAEALHKENPEIKPGKSNVSRWERGENTPNDLTLKAIADLGGITVEELLGVDDPLEEIYQNADKEALGKYIKYSRLSKKLDKDELVKWLKVDDIFSGEQGIEITTEDLEAIENGDLKPTYQEAKKFYLSLNMGQEEDFEHFINGNMFKKFNKENAVNLLSQIIPDFDENDEIKASKMIETLNKIPIFDRASYRISQLYEYLNQVDGFESIEAIKDFYQYNINELGKASDKAFENGDIELAKDLAGSQSVYTQTLNKIEAYEEVYLND